MAGAAGLGLWTSIPPLAHASLAEIDEVDQSVLVTASDNSDDDRGSGRLRQRASLMHLGFRGSGRVNPAPVQPAPPQAVLYGYRGSGRIQPITPGSA